MTLELSSARVRENPDHSTEGSMPEVIALDDRPELTSKALDAWAVRNRVHLRFIDPGKPMPQRIRRKLQREV